ncbi:unnamed protein product [Auanema sp. JU1783]|nr:unnamed protein product [Auanema sp. JU1783]
MIVLILVVLYSNYAAANNGITRIEERLTTDRDFYDRWMKLVQTQASQYSEQMLDYPVGYVMSDIQKCHRAAGNSQEDANRLRPADIAIYADMGHLSTYCNSNFSMLQHGLLDSCTHRSSSTGLPTLEKLLRVFNPNLTVVEDNERDDLLTEQARNLAEAIRKIKNYNDIWKMIAIIPSIQDGEASETGQTAVEVLAAIEEFHKLLPERTIIVVLRSSGTGIWSDASHSQQACKDMLSQWKAYSQFNSNSVWTQVEDIVKVNFEKDNFTVEFLPLLKNAALQNLPEGIDLSVLGYDCAHFSDRGLSLLHLSIWNSLMTRTPDRTSEYRPIPSAVVCPDPKCPFIRTGANSAYCIWVEDSPDEQSLAPHLIVVSILALALLLTILLLVCVCRQPSRTQDYKSTAKPFGANFSSIKFIDEDVI